MSDAYANVLQYFNVALTCVFAVEAVVKLIGFGLRVSALSTRDERVYTCTCVTVV